MKTTAGDWQPIAQNVADRMMRSAILETCRAAYLTAKGKTPDDPKLRLANRHKVLLYDVLAPKYDGRGDQLEKLGNAIVRMIVLALHDDGFINLASMNWRRAITIARWADHDISAARAEIERLDDDGNPPGTLDTERRYKTAIAAIPKEGQERAAPTRSHRLTFAMLEANGFARLDACIAHFERFRFGRYVCHVVANELPSLASASRANDIQKITEIVASSGVISWYLQPTATFVVRHGIASDNATKRALDALAFIDTNPGASTRFKRDVEAILPKPQQTVSADVLAWRRHPRWSRLPQRAAAEFGRRLFERSVYEWTIAIEEHGDPDNHPLNFIEYARRYGRRDSMLLFGDPVR